VKVETFRVTLSDTEFDRQFTMPLMGLEVSSQQAARLMRQLAARLERVPVKTHSVEPCECDKLKLEA